MLASRAKAVSDRRSTASSDDCASAISTATNASSGPPATLATARLDHRNRSVSAQHEQPAIADVHVHGQRQAEFVDGESHNRDPPALDVHQRTAGRRHLQSLRHRRVSTQPSSRQDQPVRCSRRQEHTDRLRRPISFNGNSGTVDHLHRGDRTARGPPIGGMADGTACAVRSAPAHARSSAMCELALHVVQKRSGSSGRGRDGAEGRRLRASSSIPGDPDAAARGAASARLDPPAMMWTTGVGDDRETLDPPAAEEDRSEKRITTRTALGGDLRMRWSAQRSGGDGF